MKKFFMFLSFMTVFVFAAMDYKNYFSHLDENVAIKTPAQVEIKKDIINQTRSETKSNINSGMDIPKHNSFNEKLDSQENTNIPQFKQPKPLELDRK